MTLTSARYGDGRQMAFQALCICITSLDSKLACE
jgi:hypothetical protein